jgi:hypothetical protein
MAATNDSFTLIELGNLWPRLIAYADLHLPDGAATTSTASSVGGDVKDAMVSAAVVDPHDRVSYMLARSEMKLLFPLMLGFRRQMKETIKNWEQKQQPASINMEKLLVILRMEEMSWTEPWVDACHRYCQAILIPHFQQALVQILGLHRLIVMEPDRYVITPALTDAQTDLFLTDIKSRFNDQVLDLFCQHDHQLSPTSRFRLHQRIQSAIQNTSSSSSSSSSSTTSGAASNMH